MKQYEAVIETLDKLGGVATLGELNREVFKISDWFLINMNRFADRKSTRLNSSHAT